MRSFLSMDGDPRTAVKSMVQVEGCLGMLDLGRFPDGLAVHQQLEVVCPRLSSPHQEHAKEKLSPFRLDGQGDRVFGPPCGSAQMTVLHVVEFA